jgi:hypothetical protein
MAANGKPMVRVTLDYVQRFSLLDDTYMACEGYMEKFQHSHGFGTTYEFDTPSGTKKVKYSELQIYIPVDVYTATEKKQKTKADGYKDRKTLQQFEYNDLLRYFPDEYYKWDEFTETTTDFGYMGRPEEFTTVVYKRASQGGGRRKQPKKQSRNKRASRSTRRR